MQTEVRESIVLENYGQKIFGILHRPLASEKYPAVLICHGLAGHKTGKYRLYVRLAKMLSQAGIASLRIDFRGSGDSEGEFIDMTLEGEVTDALKGLEFLQRDPHIDHSKIGIFGRSIGGMVALLAASRNRRVKSLATWAPLFDAMQWESKWKELHSANLTEEHRSQILSVNGQLPGNGFFKEFFEMRMGLELQALEHLPFLNIHGELDAVVHVEHANKYQQLREKVPGKNKFLLLATGDHDFSDPKDQSTALEETSQWFIDTLNKDA